MAQKFDARQTISRDVLSQLLGINGTELDDLLRAINKEFNAPLRISATFPTADSKLNFEASEVEATNLTGKSVGPIAASIPSFAATTIDFQTGTVTGGTVSITFPNSTIGFYRRVGFSLRKDSILEAVFSAESGTLGGLAAPGTLFIEGAIPIGWIDLEATATSPGRFKTAGSSTNIIENKVSSSQRIHCITSLNYNQQEIQFSVADDNSTGSATLSTPTTGIIRLTSGSLTSIAGIPALASGRFLIIQNKTGNSIFVNNEETTATAANRIQTGTNGNVSMTNNASFLFVYDATTSRWQLVGGTGSGSGSGGAKNYLGTVNNINGNGDFELGSTTGWSLAHTTLSSLVPNQASGSWTAASGNLSLSAVTSGKLAGTYSGSLASSAASVAGDMLVSDAFTIDLEDQAKVLTFKFYYSATSGATNLNFSGTSSNTLQVYIYDVTNSAWIQPAGVYGMTQGSGVGICTGTFQTTSNSTQYRLALVNVNASAGAYTILVDDFVVGPQTAPIGAVVTDWVSYTPTWTASTTNPTLGNGTLNGRWRRDGDSLEGRIQIIGGSTTNYGSGMWGFSLPSGVSIDSSKAPFGLNLSVGKGFASDVGVNVYQSTVLVTNATTLNVNNGGVNSFSSTVPFAWGTGDTLDFTFRVPIVGWSSQVQMSNDTDTRVVLWNGVTSSTQTINTTFTQVTGFTSTYDTHGAFSSNSYTIPVSGFYKIAGSVYFNANGTASQFISSAYKNGSPISYGPRTASSSVVAVSAPYDGATFCNAGDVITFYALATTATNINGANSSDQRWTIERLSGPATIAASESVNARYTSTATTAFGNGPTTVAFSTKDYDSHNAVSSSVFTAPVSGKYNIRAQIYTNGVMANQQNLWLYARKNSSQTYLLGTTFSVGSVSTQNCITSGSTTLHLNAGETIDIRFVTNTAGNQIQNSTAEATYFEIYRVGN